MCNELEQSQTKNEVFFRSNFYLKKHIKETSIVELTVDDEVRSDTKIHFIDVIDSIYYQYSASVTIPLKKSLPLNEQIRHCSLSIKSADGTPVGLYNIFNNINGMYQLF